MVFTGNPCSDVFWIKSGIGKRSYLTEQGTEITIALFEKGDVYWWLAE